MALLLFIPIYFYTDVYYDIRDKKLGFCLTLYDKIKLVGGYATAIAGGVAFHISQKKALLFTYRDMDEERKKYSPQKGFHLKMVALAIETGAEYFLPTLFLQKTAKACVAFFAENKRILRSEIALLNDDCFRVFGKIKVRITIFSQLCILIKYLTGRIMAIWQRKTKNLTN